MIREQDPSSSHYTPLGCQLDDNTMVSQSFFGITLSRSELDRVLGSLDIARLCSDGVYKKIPYSLVSSQDPPAPLAHSAVPKVTQSTNVAIQGIDGTAFDVTIKVRFLRRILCEHRFLTMLFPECQGCDHPLDAGSSSAQEFVGCQLMVGCCCGDAICVYW